MKTKGLGGWGGGVRTWQIKKLQQLKFNLYSPGSGLTQLKVRESNSIGWYVMSRQSPLGSSGTWLYTLPTRAHSMFSGNNNTSHRLTAYLCKNRGGEASGKPWHCSLKSAPSDMCHSLLLCFLFLISLAEMGNSITERIWFVTLRCLPLHVAFEKGGTEILPFFFFLFLRQRGAVHV